MNLSTEIFGDVIVVHAPEELGKEIAQTFQAYLTGLTLNQVVLDLDGAESLDSAALNAILNAQDELRAAQGELKVITHNTVNRKILEITRVDQRLEVYDSVIDAVKSFL